MDLLSDYSDVNLISKDYVDKQQKKWKQKSAGMNVVSFQIHGYPDHPRQTRSEKLKFICFQSDRASLSTKFARNLLKIIAINRANLDTLEKKVKEKLADEHPDLDLEQLDQSTATLDLPTKIKEGQGVDLNSVDDHDLGQNDDDDHDIPMNNASDSDGQGAIWIES